MTRCRLLPAAVIGLLLTASPLVSAADIAATTVPPWPAGLPVYDHVVIVFEENKDYDEIIGNSNAPYLNLTLRAEGATLTRMFGEEHHSQGNYFWLFSGSNQNVGFDDQVPTSQITAPNLGAALFVKGLSFKGYSEDLPAVGSLVEFGPNAAGKKSYARKHNPWVSFSFLPGDELSGAANLRFVDFPNREENFNNLPTVAIVVPGQKHDMHDGSPKKSIPAGDAWLRKHIDAYYQWAKSHNSLLIVTWDENDRQFDSKHPLGITVSGLTDPFVAPSGAKGRSIQNRIPTLIAGAHVKQGDFPEGKGVTHVNLLRTLEAMYGLPRAGSQQPKAAAGGIRDDYVITDVFQ